MKLFFREYGDPGPVLLILHGLLGSLDNWHSIASELSKSFHVFTIDLRNHGHSPHSNEFNYQVMVSDLLEFMEDQSLSSATIIGHSMGGKAAMHFALQHEEKTDKLVVVDMGIKEYDEAGHDDVFTALFSVDMKSVKSRKDAEEQIKKTIDDYAVQQFLLKNLTRNKDETYSWKMDLNSIHSNYAEIIKAVEGNSVFTKKTLFIRGGRSGYVRDVDLPEIKARFPQMQLVTIENSGHWVHAEAPKEFLQQLISFLNN